MVPARYLVLLLLAAAIRHLDRLQSCHVCLCFVVHPMHIHSPIEIDTLLDILPTEHGQDASCLVCSEETQQCLFAFIIYS